MVSRRPGNVAAVAIKIFTGREFTERALLRSRAQTNSYDGIHLTRRLRVGLSHFIEQEFVDRKLL